MTNTYTQEYQHILDAIEFDNEGQPITADKDKVQYIYNRFHSEYGWNIERHGEFNSMVEWMQGLAINIDYNNHDILKNAVKWGSLPKNATEKQEDKILDNYWKFMAMRVLDLFRKYKTEVK